MKIENTEVYGFKSALAGMRNPKNSWEKSDSILDADGTYGAMLQNVEKVSKTYANNKIALAWLLRDGVKEKYFEDNRDVQSPLYLYYHMDLIGKNDMTLALALIKGGTEHRKFLRQIFVSVDLTIPGYIATELDTYKISTTCNSCSSVHKLTSKPITIDDFEIDDLNKEVDAGYLKEVVIPHLEDLRLLYVSTKDKRYWKELIRLLPQSYCKKRTMTFNYENLMNIYNQRKAHRFNEWSGLDNKDLTHICGWIENLPYMGLFLGLSTLE